MTFSPDKLIKCFMKELSNEILREMFLLNNTRRIQPSAPHNEAKKCIQSRTV